MIIRSQSIVSSRRCGHWIPCTHISPDHGIQLHGQQLTMADGSEWFHSYCGRAPIQTKEARS